jgi:hypothetical protein
MWKLWNKKNVKSFFSILFGMISNRIELDVFERWMDETLDFSNFPSPEYKSDIMSSNSDFK